MWRRKLTSVPSASVTCSHALLAEVTVPSHPSCGPEHTRTALPMSISFCTRLSDGDGAAASAEALDGRPRFFPAADSSA